MSSKTSAGLLLHRNRGSQVFLVHPGGPLWAKKDAGAWSLPKGEVTDGEDPLEAAKREFSEETGFAIEGAEFHPLRPIKQPSGKVVRAWLVEFDCDPAEVRSNVFSMEWPPRSGQMKEFPEVDRAAWFTVSEARTRILPGQVNFIDQLIELLAVSGARAPTTSKPPKQGRGTLW